MSQGPPKYRKPRPDQSPSITDIDNAERWAGLSDTSLATTQTAAEKWRTGLAAFVTLVTGGFLLKGPETVQELERGWLAVMTLMAAAGLGCAIAGLWLALRAAAGSPARANLVSVVERFGGVRQFEIAAARSASKKLARARALVGSALVLLGATVIAWWWIPEPSLTPPAFIKVEIGDSEVCGTLLSGDNSRLRIRVDGEESPTAIPLADLDNLRIVADC